MLSTSHYPKPVDRSTLRWVFDAAAICTPGLEAVCEAELRALGLKPKAIAAGVIQFKAKPRQLYAANVWLRTATRVVVRIAKFRATDFPHLEERAKEVDWKQWLPAGFAPEFRVSSSKSKLYHTEAIAQRLHLVVGPKGMPEREGQPAQPTQRFTVRLFDDVVTVSADSTGEGLQRRPWRQDIGVAPIRPPMAAAMLLGSGWNGQQDLLDPFCGSGTIAIEAALIASGMPPGGDREFAFMHWPNFDTGSWASVKGSIASTAKEASEKPPIVVEASDRDGAAIEATKANAERAGVADRIHANQLVVSHLKGHNGQGLIATNPPYGKRVGGADLKALYRKFGAIAAERLPNWDMAIVASDAKLVKHIDRSLTAVESFGHGGIKVKIFRRSAADSSPNSAQSHKDQAESQDAKTQ